jgi:hypothetical protein
VSTNPFSPSSRYYNVAVTSLLRSDNRTISYLRRRFVPDPSLFTTLTVHTVIEGERLDRLTYSYLGDPLQFWRVVDANGALEPDDLETPQRIVRITLPQGLPGVPGA